MANAGRDADCTPLLTLMTILPYAPAWAAVGVPESMPLVALKVAHAGRFWIEKVSAVPAGALVVGWNEYALPEVTCVGGLPEMVSGAVTLIANGASEAESCPSLTLITMLP